MPLELLENERRASRLTEDVCACLSRERTASSPPLPPLVAVEYALLIACIFCAVAKEKAQQC